MKKIKIIFIVVAFLLIIFMVACSKGIVEETFDSKEVTDINITTGGNDIIFLISNNDNIKVTLEDCSSTLGNIKNGVLNISTPTIQPGINVSSAKQLYIYLPRKQYAKITAHTKIGDIKIQDIDIINLKLTSEHGKIQISNMVGKLEATATMGTIETDLEIGKNIVKDEKSLIQRLSGEISANSDKSIILQTNDGKIILD